MAEQILQSPIVDEVEQSFLDYGLSVITDRAIPSLEDGLKPVARRILWDMQDNGYTHDKRYVKSAVPVGQTLGRAHPHGDASVYGALVQLSQPWSMRYPLIDLHGSGGSQDGDEPAAARYTECRLSKAGEAMMYNLKKNCVDWQNTYTDEEQEPVYLPGLFPTLLVNGTTGIAVAVATSLAPHNLNEIVDAIIYTAQNPNCKCEDLLTIVQGPDFPGGGQIINKDELKVAYLTGHGRVKVRGQYKIEKNSIIFTSVPYKVSKVDIIQQIDKLCDEKKLDGIVSIHDDSSLTTGVRLVIEFDKNTNVNVLINRLFKFTSLENNFNIMQIVLDKKTPKMLSLLDLIKGYISHQLDVITRVSMFDIKKLNDRKHILEGFLIALEDIDNVITLIKKSENSTIAKNNLMAEYSLSEAQAKAILDMKLSRLARLERIEIGKEKAEIEDKLTKLAQIVRNPTPELISQLNQLKKDFGDKRRTEVTQIEEVGDEKALIEPEKCVVVLTAAGTVKRIPAQSFRTQRRNGKGVKTQEDITTATIRTNTVDNLMVFTNLGKVYKVSVNDIVVGTNTSKGQDLRALIQMEPNEKPNVIYSIYRDTTAKYILFVTKNGIVKKTPLEEYASIKRKDGISAIKLRDGDTIAAAALIDEEPIAIATHNGYVNYFSSKDILPTARSTIGVKGINLTKDDYVISALPHRDTTDTLAIFTEDGYAKRYTGRGLLLGKRGKTGCIVSPKPISAIAYLNEEDNVLISGITNSLCVAANEIPNIKGEKALGSSVIKGTNISAVTKI